MSTTHATTSPTAEELQVWTEQVRDWFDETGKKRISKDLKADLAVQGARWCPTCRTVKAVTEFSKNSGKADGLRHKCKPCDSGAVAEYYAANREERIEYALRYRAENREENGHVHMASWW